MRQISAVDFVRLFGIESIVYAGNDFKKALCAIRGHWVYVRRECVPTDTGGLALPEKSEDVCDWFEVIAKGVDVGKPRKKWPNLYGRSPKADIKEYGKPYSVFGIEIGCKVLLPRGHPLIRSSPFCEHELLVDESVIIAMVEPE